MLSKSAHVTRTLTFFGNAECLHPSFHNFALTVKSRNLNGSRESSVRDKFFPLHVIKAHGANGPTAPLILKLYTKFR
jgi:hypothetical protein